MPKSKSTKSASKSDKLPKILVFANQKITAGKSTVAFHAVDWFTQKEHNSIVVDAPAQQSSSAWLKDLRLAWSLQQLVILSRIKQTSKLLPSGLSKLIHNAIRFKYFTVKPRAG